MINSKQIFISTILLAFAKGSSVVSLPLNSLCQGKWANYPLCSNNVLSAVTTKAWNDRFKFKTQQSTSTCPPDWSEELCQDFMNNFPGAAIHEVIPAGQNTAKPPTTVTPTSTPTTITGGCTPFPIWLPGTGQIKNSNCSKINQSSIPISQYGCTKGNILTAWCRLFYFMYMQSNNMKSQQ